MNINEPVSVFIEGLKEVLGLDFADLEAIVNKRPAEVINVHLAVAVLVEGVENFGNFTDSVA